MDLQMGPSVTIIKEPSLREELFPGSLAHYMDSEFSCINHQPTVDYVSLALDRKGQWWICSKKLLNDVVP